MLLFCNSHIWLILPLDTISLLSLSVLHTFNLEFERFHTYAKLQSSREFGLKWSQSSSSSPLTLTLTASSLLGRHNTIQTYIHSMLMMMMMIMKTHKAVRHSQQFRHQLHSRDSIKGFLLLSNPSSLLHIKTQPQHFFFFNQYPFRQHSKHSKHTSIIVINQFHSTRNPSHPDS
jgi:hypothetical protein